MHGHSFCPLSRRFLFKRKGNRKRNEQNIPWRLLLRSSLPGEFPHLSDPLASRSFILPWGYVPSQLPLWLALFLTIISASFFYYVSSTQRSFSIIVGNYKMELTSQHRQVAAVLRDAGIRTRPEDAVFPPLESTLQDGQEIIIQRAIPVSIAADGNFQNLRTQQKFWTEILDEAGVSVSPYDVLYVEGKATNTDESAITLHHNSRESSVGLRMYGVSNSAPALSARGGYRPQQITGMNYEELVDVKLVRAVNLYIHDDNVVYSLPTTENTLGRALKVKGVEILENDIVSEPLDSEVKNGKHIYIKRAKPLSIQVDGKVIHHRTQLANIGAALAEAKILVSPIDRIEPPVNTVIRNNLSVGITRIKEDVITDTIPIEFATRYEGDSETEIDNRYIANYGSNGIKARRLRVTYENGVEVNRVVERDWVEKEPQDKIIAYGTKIVIRELQTPSGPISYWRKMRMYATSYSPSNAGKPKSSPGYGRTALGLVAAKGIAAIDPRVVPYYTKMYVPGYGIAMAGDTGGGVKGLMIDLAYADDEPNYWSSRYVDVYFLAPVPPASQIRWMID